MPITENTNLEYPKCGANRITSGDFVICPKCGEKVRNVATMPEVEQLMTNASELLFSAEFTNAFTAFESLITKFPNSYKAHWGAVLAKCGILFEEDCKEKNKLFDIHNSPVESITLEPHYKNAISLAPEVTRINYKRWAEKLDKMRVGGRIRRAQSHLSTLISTLQSAME